MESYTNFFRYFWLPLSGMEHITSDLVHVINFAYEKYRNGEKEEVVEDDDKNENEDHKKVWSRPTRTTKEVKYELKFGNENVLMLLRTNMAKNKQL